MSVPLTQRDPLRTSSAVSCVPASADAVWTGVLGLGAELSAAAPLVELVRVETHTCYVGERSELHAWGFGCGECPACRLRKRGYEAFLAGEQVSEPL